jgi:hypothetical protein
VVDKLHIKGHVDPECFSTCHPRLFPELDDNNTVICEQVNYWLGNFKHIVKHMNFYRFNYFLLIILDLYNQAIKIAKRIRNANKFFGRRSTAVKRSYEHN